jgi:hypothetical protein
MVTGEVIINNHVFYSFIWLCIDIVLLQHVFYSFIWLCIDIVIPHNGIPDQNQPVSFPFQHHNEHNWSADHQSSFFSTNYPWLQFYSIAIATECTDL